MPSGSSDLLRTRVIRTKLSELKLLEKNARFMKGATFARLVANLKKDGCLTSLPLVRRDEDGKLEVISGNHRVAAGLKAGIEESDVIEVTSPLTRAQFVALQLSHNAVAGEDDPNILRSLYDELDLGWKEYSGLTDDAFNIADLDTSMLRVEQPFYEELHVSFLPGDAEVFNGWLEKITKAKPAPVLVGLYDDFDLFFDTVIKVKRLKGVHNTAVALRMMAELAAGALAAEEAKAARAAERAAKPAAVPDGANEARQEPAAARKKAPAKRGPKPAMERAHAGA
jgi:hypothetical protein